MTEVKKSELNLNSNFKVNSFYVGKINFNSSIQDIDITEIVDIYVDYKGYEKMKFSDRLELLKQNIGWIHYASGAAFAIENGIIKQIKLSKRYIENNNTSKKELIEFFGKPDIELVDDICYSGFDYNIDAYILVFREKNIYAFIDPKTEILKEIRLGILDENIYYPKIISKIDKTNEFNRQKWWKKIFR
jgi:hypothetical protein